MRIVVGPLEAVETLIARHDPARVISLLAPAQAGPELSDRPHLRLDFHDISALADGLTAPGDDAVRRLIAFARAPPPPELILIHCWFAISRSPAAAYIVACALRGDGGGETELADALRAASPQCTPNPSMIALADAQLNRRGRMVEAIAAIGRGREATCGAGFILELPSSLA